MTSTIKLGDVLTIDQAMLLAIEEAKKGAGFVAPNPLVGCVILSRDHRVIAVGHHARLGDDHAEIAALKKVNDPRLLQQAILVVTLEPCAHEGRTPSCAKHLATLPIAEVIYGVQDPNPLVQGKGHQIIQEAQIKVRAFENHQEELLSLIEVFVTNMKESRAFLSLKAAVSLDGQLALSSGESQWITGDRARLEGHKLRAIHSAVMVGRGTVEVDNPRLTARHPEFQGVKNSVVVLDPEMKLLSANDRSLFQDHQKDKLFWIVDQDKLRANSASEARERVQLIACARSASGRFLMSDLMQKLFEHRLYSVLFELGPGQLSGLFIDDLFDRLHLFQSMSFLGEGLSISKNLRLKKLSQRKNLRLQEVHQLNQDLHLSLLGPSHFLSGN